MKKATHVALALVLVLPGVGAAVASPRSEGPGDVEIEPIPLPDEGPRNLIEQLAEKYDPARDVWDTEVLAGAADKQLHVLAHWLEDPASVESSAVSKVAAPGFTGGSLVPPDLTTRFTSADLTVRGAEGTAAASPDGPVHSGPEGLQRALAELRGLFDEGSHARLKMKVIRVEPADEGFATRLRVEAFGRSGGHSLQWVAGWLARWSRPEEGALPALVGLELQGAYDEAALSSSRELLFVEETPSVMRDVPSYTEQMVPGIPYWTKVLSRVLRTSTFGHHGIAVGDADGDGLEDLYVCDAGGLPNRLYIQRADGTVRDASAAAGVDWEDYSTAALFVDLDNDGDEDLAVAARPSILFAENDGTGRFELRTRVTGIADPVSLVAADFDGDGLLDVFTTSYNADAEHTGLAVPVPYFNATNGGPNALIRNEGGFRFRNVTRQVGLDSDNHRYSFAAAWEDFDSDGDPDLYVANDFGPNHLWRNDGGRFVDVAREVGVEDVATGMSVSWGDYDRDGLVDLYVGNMFSSAGNRVTYQPRFATENPGARTPEIQRMARGNTLFANAGDGTYRDVSEVAGVTMGRWAWASRFTDLNNDGWEDLVVMNGYISNEDSGDL